MKNIPKVEQSIQSDTVLLSCSAGDLCQYDTFMTANNMHVNLTAMLQNYYQNSEIDDLYLFLYNIFIMSYSMDVMQT